ncbi:MAG: hypothetical protein HRT69_13650 [Flavobacteriaceae bacterium]|nr:hypothetical protein [Flavobacteriaceae bacterium]
MYNPKNKHQELMLLTPSVNDLNASDDTILEFIKTHNNQQRSVICHLIRTTRRTQNTYVGEPDAQDEIKVKWEKTLLENYKKIDELVHQHNLAEDDNWAAVAEALGKTMAAVTWNIGELTD